MQRCSLAQAISDLGCSDFIALLNNGPGTDDMGMIEIGELAVDEIGEEFAFTEHPHRDVVR
jgi:hypothetical protein